MSSFSSLGYSYNKELRSIEEGSALDLGFQNELERNELGLEVAVGTLVAVVVGAVTVYQDHKGQHFHSPIT